MRVLVWVCMCVFPSAAGVSVGRGSYLLRPAAALLLWETTRACLDKRKDEQTRDVIFSFFSLSPLLRLCGEKSLAADKQTPSV